MANLILTNKCQRKCAYCFAINNGNSNEEMSFDNFLKAVDFIATGHKIISLIGGEPTLNRDFVNMVEYLINEDFTVQVFTNGMVSTEIINYIKSIVESPSTKNGQLSFSVNVNESKYRTVDENRQQELFLKTIGRDAYLSFTIHDAACDMSFIVDMINSYKLDRTLRLGLSMPIFNSPNKFLPIEEYENVASKVVEFIEHNSDIDVKFDCGFTLCMFSIEDIKVLNKFNKDGNFAFICGQPIDIYPDLSVANCYPLSTVYKNKISNFDNLGELISNLDESLMTVHGIHGERCANCSFFRKVCFGGCKGFYKPVG